MPQTRTTLDAETSALAGRCFEVSKTASFEAAHRLPQKDPDHPYGRLHGHSFEIEVVVRGQVPEGERWVEDFDVLSKAVADLTATLDHGYLNEITGLETPTLERLCVWCAERLQPRLPGLSRITLSRPSLKERCSLTL